jgi:chromatin structure-remodeling complex subunit RSC1/2
MFLELVDRADWPQYFEVIPEPRCFNNIRSSLEKNRYKDALDVYTDLSLVIWNAMYYNEPDSQISHDAGTLMAVKVMVVAKARAQSSIQPYHAHRSSRARNT